MKEVGGEVELEKACGSIILPHCGHVLGGVSSVWGVWCEGTSL